MSSRSSSESGFKLPEDVNPGSQSLDLTYIISSDNENDSDDDDHFQSENEDGAFHSNQKTSPDPDKESQKAHFKKDKTKKERTKRQKAERKKAKKEKAMRKKAKKEAKRAAKSSKKHTTTQLDLPVEHDDPVHTKRKRDTSMSLPSPPRKRQTKPSISSSKTPTPHLSSQSPDFAIPPDNLAIQQTRSTHYASTPDSEGDREGDDSVDDQVEEDDSDDDQVEEDDSDDDQVEEEMDEDSEAEPGEEPTDQIVEPPFIPVKKGKKISETDLDERGVFELSLANRMKLLKSIDAQQQLVNKLSEWYAWQRALLQDDTGPTRARPPRLRHTEVEAPPAHIQASAPKAKRPSHAKPAKEVLARVKLLAQYNRLTQDEVKAKYLSGKIPLWSELGLVAVKNRSTPCSYCRKMGQTCTEIDRTKEKCYFVQRCIPCAIEKRNLKQCQGVW